MSYFAFSPGLPAGLFDSILEYPSVSVLHSSSTPTNGPSTVRLGDGPSTVRLGDGPSTISLAASASASALPTYSPPQLPPSNDYTNFSGAETLVSRDPPSDLPLLVKDKPPQIPNLAADDSLHASVCADIAARLALHPAISADIPPSKILQGFLASFLECYYRHHPFIHLPTLSTPSTPAPLILAMCCIGALYRLDRRRAQRLYAIATLSIAEDVRLFTKTSEDCPLWKDLATSVMDENGFYTLLYGKVRLALAAENADVTKMTWTSWVLRESWKRLLAGIYVASTVHVIIWDANPNFNTCRDLELEVLHDESFWNAKTAGEWRELRANQPQQDYRTMRDGLASIMSETAGAGAAAATKGDSPTGRDGKVVERRLSPLTALLLMHAVVVHMWQVVQVAQALSPASLSLGHDPVSALLMRTAVRSLARCHELLVVAQGETAGEPGHEEGTSQIFNCQATLRMAYIRLFSLSNGPFNRPSLITLDPAAIKSYVSTFAITKAERSPQRLDAVVKAFDGLRTPVRMGHMLVRKTAALRWSPAHAIAGWDCALFVCTWVHSVEMDQLNDIEPSPAELELLATIADVLEEAEYDTGKSKSLAAGVARTWSWLLQDVWVWSITPRMGSVLEQMATAFERLNNESRRPGH
ncbi:hypothetical protein B0T22DRAFT_388174 [Podospora appendiculata]|uniref:Transcription factor domain-containing protein n=1 Tax=Podospora appendiculata TaxID=314037 RepID=A0AAE0WZ00_9PEZI|nr:hypothetical protein B0T22DRAFT_388174 [Podospora appendiculata]